MGNEKNSTSQLQGKEWRKEYNNFPMRPLGWLCPREFIEKYKSQEESLRAI